MRALFGLLFAAYTVMLTLLTVYIYQMGMPKTSICFAAASMFAAYLTIFILLGDSIENQKGRR